MTTRTFNSQLNLFINQIIDPIFWYFVNVLMPCLKRPFDCYLIGTALWHSILVTPTGSNHLGKISEIVGVGWLVFKLPNPFNPTISLIQENEKNRGHWPSKRARATGTGVFL